MVFLEITVRRRHFALHEDIFWESMWHVWRLCVLLVHFVKITQVCVEKWEDGRGRSRDGRGGCNRVEIASV